MKKGDAQIEGVRGRRSVPHDSSRVDACGGAAFAVPRDGDQSVSGRRKVAHFRNLALSFAEAGCRTLLIDGDIRRNQLHTAFEGQRRPGLVDCLLGSVEPTDVMQPSSRESGPPVVGARRQRGPELLASQASTVASMSTVEPRFDAIIVDSSPLGAGIDPLALGIVTRNMIMVLKNGQTDRRLRRAKLERRSSSVRLLGAVLNVFTASTHLILGRWLRPRGGRSHAHRRATSEPPRIRATRGPSRFAWGLIAEGAITEAGQEVARAGSSSKDVTTHPRDSAECGEAPSQRGEHFHRVDGRGGKIGHRAVAGANPHGWRGPPSVDRVSWKRPGVAQPAAGRLPHSWLAR